MDLVGEGRSAKYALLGKSVILALYQEKRHAQNHACVQESVVHAWPERHARPAASECFVSPVSLFMERNVRIVSNYHRPVPQMVNSFIPQFYYSFLYEI